MDLEALQQGDERRWHREEGWQIQGYLLRFVEVRWGEESEG
jgi:hypothetical protein